MISLLRELVKEMSELRKELKRLNDLIEAIFKTKNG